MSILEEIYDNASMDQLMQLVVGRVYMCGSHYDKIKIEDKVVMFIESGRPVVRLDVISGLARFQLIELYEHCQGLMA